MSRHNPRWPALRALARELGWLSAVRTGVRVERAGRRGEPFEALPAPEDERERLSREQVGPAIVLYRELKRSRPPDEARRITRAVVEATGQVFLRRNLGRLQRSRLAVLSDDERQRFVEAKGQRFFNATIRWDRVTPDDVHFTVTACTFPRLCRAGGAPELATVFCGVDAAYFGSVDPNVVLERPQTIAEGAPDCPFHLKWTD